MPGKQCASAVGLNVNDRVDWLMLEWGDRWIETKECIRWGGGAKPVFKNMVSP